jgi:hypothetical protein
MPFVILGGYTLCARVGGVLLTKQVRDDLLTRVGTLEMRLLPTPQIISPEILFKTDWPFQGAQWLSYLFARLLPFAFALFCVLVIVFRKRILVVAYAVKSRFY